MDLNQMLIFAKVAEYQSFTKAAEELAMKKSNISIKVRKLEERLGVRLLNRTTRSVSLTEAGAGYYQYCTDILSKAEEADAYAESLLSEPKGNLRITLPLDIGQLMTSSLIQPFLEKYPKINIDLFFSNRKVDLIKERFDLALRAGFTSLEDSSYIYRTLFRSTSGIFASKKYVEKRGIPGSPEELHNHELIAFASSDRFDDKILLKAKIGHRSLNLSMKYRLKVNDMKILLEAAQLGLGLVVLPTLFFERFVKSGELVRILPELTFPEVGLHAVYPTRYLKSSKLQAFLDFIQSWNPEF